MISIIHDVAAKPQSVIFTPKCFLSFDASNERLMRPPRGLAKVSSWQVDRIVALCAGGGMSDIRRYQTVVPASCILCSVPRSIGILIALLAALWVAPATAGCNSGNVANSDLLSSANCQAAASGANATAVGPGASAAGVNDTAVGAGAIASTSNSTAVGVNAAAIGASSAAYGDHSIASGADSTASGSSSTAQGISSSAYGHTSRATGDFGSAYGVNSTAQGNYSSAYGNLSTATGESSSAYGDNSTAQGRRSSAYGYLSTASGDNSVALGGNAQATANNSVALGAGSVATQANTVSVGSAGNERRITNVAAGINPTDAVNVSQLSGIASGFQSQLSGLQGQVDTNRTEARRGVAAAMAMTTASMPSAAGRTSWAINVANFHGQSATGGSLAHRLNTGVPLAITAGYAYGGGDNHGARVGLAGEF
jgi:hypothetical protein